MLHERQLVGLMGQQGCQIQIFGAFPRGKAGQVIEQAIDQSGFDGKTENAAWSLNGLAAFLAAHARS